MNSSPETTAAEPESSIACLIIKTGRNDCYAHFYPALYQLTLVRSGIEEKIDLGYSGSRLLERLVREPGEVVAREELMSHAWADRVVGQGSLNQQIYTLRQILGDEKSREIIQTLPRRGYLLNPSYLVYPPSIDDIGAVQEADAPGTQPNFLHRHSRRSASWLVLLSALGLMAVGLFVALYQFSLPARLHSSELNLGQISLLYVDQDAQRLQQLILQTHGLASRLSELSAAPAELIIGNSGGFFEVLCMQPGGGARSLMFHESQLAHLADDQLNRCLP
jgi:DNA-binding winged helix-turn-helix (wHTH) protein